MSNTVLGAIFGIAAGAIWGGMYVVSDVVLTVIPPFTLLTLRLILGILVLGMFLRWKWTELRHPNYSELARLLGVGLLGFGISVGAQFVGTDKSTAVNGSLVTSASPAFILLFAALILREKLTVQRIAAVALATIGVIIIIDPGKANFNSDTFFGDLMLAAAAVTWGIFSVVLKQVSENFDAILVTCFGFVGGLFLTVPASALELTNRPIGTVDGEVLLGVLYLGIVSTAGAMWLWNRAFMLVDASTASLFFFAQPLVGAVLSVIVLHQVITSGLLLGGILIGIGVLFSLYPLEKLMARKTNPAPQI
jgi:drug/metabolite transporter (DMT)-like permease